MIIDGQCQCGNLSFELATDVARSEIDPRACDCSFCRIHAAKCWSDPNGKVLIHVRDDDALHKYRFALKTADFYLCQACGAYLAAVLFDADGRWATVNLQLTELADLPASPASYGAEDIDQRIARRKQLWTPAQITVNRDE